MMTPTDKLMAWHGKWILLDATITCRSCKAAQAESERGFDFPHERRCVRTVSSLGPWSELDEVREAFSSVDRPMTA